MAREEGMRGLSHPGVAKDQAGYVEVIYKEEYNFCSYVYNVMYKTLG